MVITWAGRFIWLLLLTGLVLFALALGASAQTTTPVPAGIDFGPIIEQVIGLISALLLLLSGWIGILIRTWLAQKLQMNKIKHDEQIQAVYSEAAQRSMAFAESSGHAPKKGLEGDKFVETAAEYLQKFWPDMVESAGLTHDEVKQTIIARLPSGDETVKAEAITLAKAGATVAPAATVKK